MKVLLIIEVVLEVKISFSLAFLVFLLMTMTKRCLIWRYNRSGAWFLKLFVSKIRKDKSDDTLAYKDCAHKVILRTFSYFLKILTHIGQEWFIFKNYLFQR